MTKIKAVDFLSQVRTVEEFETFVSLLASTKGAITSQLQGFANDTLTSDIEELISEMEYTVQWINDRLESGAYDGNYDVLDSLRGHKSYLNKSIFQLQNNIEYSITIQIQQYTEGLEWKDTPVEERKIYGVDREECESNAYQLVKIISKINENEIRYTINNSSNGRYVGSDYKFNNYYNKGGKN
ncbi:hypothetical protein PQE68_gp010 [Bacillus phage vB_BanS_Sophrita]|uniref:Uncharacterized protein n=1 Tax=Bacillus phage vB_BanS_Sophrita TaxID=2894790 RepID=A0AAE8YTP0_9CAUD|nr:hypothetical protein PQE68_gp010 [Bacillus phage vB_BanS_Sophrita]UGO50601.1 hypothetical protein SOPHRITA_10 [Bacillus phage vB_BanS_Sophrita]